jgi:hypothetical protein
MPAVVKWGIVAVAVAGALLALRARFGRTKEPGDYVARPVVGD